MFRRGNARPTRLPRSERERPRQPRQPRVSARQAAENEQEQREPDYRDENLELYMKQQANLKPMKRKGSSNKAGSQISNHTMITQEVSPGVYGV